MFLTREGIIFVFSWLRCQNDFSVSNFRVPLPRAIGFAGCRIRLIAVVFCVIFQVWQTIMWMRQICVDWLAFRALICRWRWHIAWCCCGWTNLISGSRRAVRYVTGAGIFRRMWGCVEVAGWWSRERRAERVVGMCLLVGVRGQRRSNRERLESLTRIVRLESVASRLSVKLSLCYKALKMRQ